MKIENEQVRHTLLEIFQWVVDNNERGVFECHLNFAGHVNWISTSIKSNDVGELRCCNISLPGDDSCDELDRRLQAMIEFKAEHDKELSPESVEANRQAEIQEHKDAIAKLEAQA